MNKLIIDTDSGHDDVLAMMLLLKSGRFNVQAITTVAGNSTITNVTRNTAFTLDLLNMQDVPVFSGAAKPLARDLTKAVVHGDSGLAGADTTATAYKITGDASRQINDLITANPHEITILTLGPLTNIAQAFTDYPHLPGLVKELVIMGGAVSGVGNKNRVAEFNMFVDPEAADIVFRAPIPKTLIPFELCIDIVLTLREFEALKGTVLYAPVKNMMKPFIAGLRDDEGINGAILPDPLAAYYLLNPGAYTLEPMDVLIETQGTHTAGMTVVEKRAHKPKHHNIMVATNVRRHTFVEEFFTILRT